MLRRKKLKIIIIDDDPAINLLLETALSKLGHDVLTFSDPAACPLAQKETYTCSQDLLCADVILTDIVMPNMSGIDLLKLQEERGCRILKENKAFISATTKDEHFEAIAELGYKHFVKPFKLVDIVAWLGECASRL
ncbi:MAG: response regulator, partial [Gammaproteobacteria bacterium]|nr:response regulator [Gammaproteobacteria bacterium]